MLFLCNWLLLVDVYEENERKSVFENGEMLGKEIYWVNLKKISSFGFLSIDFVYGDFDSLLFVFNSYS